MTHDEIRAIALTAYHALPQAPDGITYVLIAVEPSTGSYQPVVSNMDVTYLIGLFQRAIISIERANYEANIRAVAAEEVKVN